MMSLDVCPIKLRQAIWKTTMQTHTQNNSK